MSFMRTNSLRPSQAKASSKGFTFFEVMVTVAILSIGLVVIYQALFVCLDTFSYYSNSLTVQRWLDVKVWEIKDELKRSGAAAALDGSGVCMSANKQVNWSLSVRPVGKGNLYELNLKCFWREGSREVNLWRVAYANTDKEEGK